MKNWSHISVPTLFLLGEGGLFKRVNNPLLSPSCDKNPVYTPGLEVRKKKYRYGPSLPFPFSPLALPAAAPSFSFPPLPYLPSSLFSSRPLISS